MRRGTVCVVATLVAATWTLAARADATDDFTIYNVMPYADGREAQSAQDAIEYRARTGNDLILYSLTLHPEGVPAFRKVEQYVASYRRLKAALAGSDVRLGVLVQAIIGHWPRVDKDIEPWQRTINIRGEEKRFCPDDPGFAKYVTDTFRLIAAEKPAFILTDDDVRAYSHEPECFCPKHIAEFNARRGTSYDGATVRAKVAAAKQDDPDYVAFLAIQREMMVRFIQRIRAAIDSQDPTIPAGVCVASEETILCPPLARAIAAKGQTPVMRVSTGCYNERFRTALPANVFRTLGFAEYYRDSGIRILDETDTCPHNLWSKSAIGYFTHLSVADFLGYTGSKSWYVNGHKGVYAVDRKYTDVLASHKGYLTALRREAAHAPLAGIAVPCFQRFARWHVAHDRYEMFIEPNTFAEAILIPFGVPFRAEKDFSKEGVYLVSTASEVERFTDAELDALFAHRVLVTGPAAVALTKRGRTDLLGLTATEDAPGVTSDRLRDRSLTCTFPPASHPARFTNLAKGAEILADYLFKPYPNAPQADVLGPSAVLATNSRGGKTLTMGYHQNMFYTSRYLESRKTYLLALLDRLNGVTTEGVVGNNQDVLTFVSTPSANTRLIHLVNLNAEPMTEVKLRFEGSPRVEALASDGSWTALNARREGEYLVFPYDLAFYGSVVFRVGR